jgi:hypothetical protein
MFSFMSATINNKYKLMRLVLFLLFIATINATGCFQPDQDINSVRDGANSPIDLFARDGGVTAPCLIPDASPLSSLRIEVQTAAIGGRFAPKNVGAIWIEDAAGRFVRTIKRWGNARAKWLTRFIASSQGNIVDAVTAATLLSHERHEVTWDLTDLTGCEVGSGEYHVIFEVTDRNGSGDSLAIPISKMQLPISTLPPDSAHFRALSLVLQ